jgi:hypothetical protein
MCARKLLVQRAKAAAEEPLAVLHSDMALAIQMVERRISRLEAIVHSGFLVDRESAELPEAVSLVGSANEILARVQCALPKLFAMKFDSSRLRQRLQASMRAYYIEYLSAQRPRLLALQNTVQDAASKEPPIVIGPTGSRSVAPQPTIASVSPVVVPLCGATPIVITGENFDPLAEVLFAKTKCKVIARSAGSITVMSPPSRSPCTIAITVRNPDGESVTVDGLISYHPLESFDETDGVLPRPNKAVAKATPRRLQLDVVDPVMCPLAGRALRLLGAGFDAGLRVEIGGVAVSDFVVSEDGEEALVTAPPLPQGLYDIRVTNPDGKVAALPKVLAYLKELPESPRSSSSSTSKGSPMAHHRRQISLPANISAVSSPDSPLWLADGSALDNIDVESSWASPPPPPQRVWGKK